MHVRFGDVIFQDVYFDYFLKGILIQPFATIYYTEGWKVVVNNHLFREWLRTFLIQFLTKNNTIYLVGGRKENTPYGILCTSNLVPVSFFLHAFLYISYKI